MAKRMKWQALIATLGSVLVIVLLAFTALSLTTESSPDFGGTYVEGVAGSPIAINPLFSQFNDVDKDLVSLIFSGLTKLDNAGRPLPDLAEAWTISEDGTVYTFELRKGVKWHDGAPFTADDVVFTINAIKSPDFKGFPDLSALWKSIAVEKVDDGTVKFTLKDPYSPILAYTTIGILPSHILGGVPVKELGETSFNAEPIGTGPYRLKETMADFVVLEANEDYYQRKPYVTRLKFKFYPDYKAILNGIKQKEVQGVSFVAPEDISRVKEMKDVSLYNTLNSMYTIMFLNDKSPLFSQKEVRQALVYGLDREKIIEVAARGQGATADSPILPGTWANEPDVKTYDYDPEKAKAMLDEAGWILGSDNIREKDGLKFQFSLMTNDDKGRVTTAEEIAKQLKAIGIRADLSASGYTGLIQNFLIPHKFDAIVFGLNTGYDPDLFVAWHSSQATADGGMNFSSFTNERADEILETARKTSSQTERAELYREFQQIFAEEVPSILLYYPTYSYAVDKSVSGVQMGVLFEPSSRLENITDWFIKTKRVRIGEK